MRGLSGALVSLLLGVIVVVVSVVISVEAPQTLDGRALAVSDAGESAENGGAQYPDVEPLATIPTPKWSAKTSDIAGTSTLSPDALQNASVLAANEKLVVGGPRKGSEVALMAFDADTGEQRWSEVSPFRADECVFSRDGRLGCLRDGATENAFEFAVIDPDTGAVTSIGPLTLTGRLHEPDLVSAGNGFLVSARRFIERAATFAVTLNWISSDGSRTWVQNPPDGMFQPELSEAGNVVAVSDYKLGARVYALDTGTVVYDSTADLERASRDSSIAFMHVAPVRSGFAVSIQGYNRTTKVYARNGTERGTIDGVVLQFSPHGSEGDLIPVSGTDQNNRTAIGVASAEKLEVIALTEFRGSLINTEILGEKYLTGADTGPNTESWAFLDVDAPTDIKMLAKGNYRVMAFDGTRAFFADRSGSNYGFSRLFALDPASGQQAWELGDRGGEREYEFVGPYLVRASAGADGEPGTISRLAAMK